MQDDGNAGYLQKKAREMMNEDEDDEPAP